MRTFEARKQELRRLLSEGAISEEEFSKEILRMVTDPPDASWEYIQRHSREMEEKIIEFVVSHRERYSLSEKSFHRRYLHSPSPVVFLGPEEFRIFKDVAHASGYRIATKLPGDGSYSNYHRMRAGRETMPADLRYPCLKKVSGVLTLPGGFPYILLESFNFLEGMSPEKLHCWVRAPRANS